MHYLGLFNSWILIVLCVSLCVHVCDASAWLQDPPSRSAAWYYQIQTPVNYNFRNLDCGNVPVKINTDGTRNCGLCGDPFTDTVPRENELGGKYANPRVRTRYYEAGQVADISIWNNLPGAPGFYEFRLCDEADNQTQACLDKHLLTIKDTGATYMEVPKTQGLIIIHVQLPADVTCEFCLLQWRFRKESLCDSQNWCGESRDPMPEYYNCADVMIGAVGSPKPTYIQDPVYTASDYGSAYDVATTRTTPDSDGLIGSTTTTTTTTTTTPRVPIITIPPVFPTGTTRSTVTTSVTTNPVTTNGPIVITTPGTTVAVPIGPVPTNSRLVVDANGNSIPGQSTTGGRNADNKYLLVLLSLLPLMGVLGSQGMRTPGIVPPVVVPPRAPVSWTQAVPVFPLGIDNAYGFGNFITGNMAAIGTGSYGNYGSKGTYHDYGSKGSHAHGYSVGNFDVPVQNSYALNTQTSKLMGTNGLVGNYQGNFQTHHNQNIGGTQFVQTQSVWNNNGVSMNNGFPRHVIRRRAIFKGTSDQHTKLIGKAVKLRYKRDEYGNQARPERPGYASHPKLVAKGPVQQVRPNSAWPRNAGQMTARWGDNGNRNWQTGVQNSWQNNGGTATSNTIAINRASAGQRFSQQEIVTPRMREITPTANSVNLPGIESASRFRLNDPRQKTETSVPLENVRGVQNGDGSLRAAIGLPTGLRGKFKNNFNPKIVQTGRRSAYDWYKMLFGRQSSRML